MNINLLTTWIFGDTQNTRTLNPFLHEMVKGLSAGTYELVTRIHHLVGQQAAAVVSPMSREALTPEMGETLRAFVALSYADQEAAIRSALVRELEIRLILLAGEQDLSLEFQAEKAVCSKLHKDLALFRFA